jgi:RNA polymerase sigma-70 factor (ECF subfamily)
LAALLAADAIAWSDGGGVKRSALNPIIGADKIARFFTGLAAKAARRGPMPSFQIKDINGAPAFLVFAGEDLDQTLSIETDGAQITAVYLVRNPEKLRRLKAASADA